MLRDQPFMRDDTFLGVCQSVGEDFRIPPNLLRVALAPVLVWNPPLTLAIYAAAGVLIAATRWIFPNPTKTARPTVAAAVEPIALPVQPELSDAPVELAKAA